MEDKACTAVTAYVTKIEIQWRKLLQQMASIFSRIFFQPVCTSPIYF